MSTARRYRNAYPDYLRLEQDSSIKLEFSDGEIFAMAGGTPEHGALAIKLAVLMSASLPATSRILSSDVKIRISATISRRTPICRSSAVPSSGRATTRTPSSTPATSSR